MFLMVEKGIAGGICISIYQYTKANKKKRKIILKIKNRYTMSQKFLVNNFVWIEGTLQ